MKCLNPTGCHNPNRCGDNNKCYFDDGRVRVDAAFDRSGFHWRNGHYFKRLIGGEVLVVKCADDGRSDRIEWHQTIPPTEWASIVCSVSAEGETSDRWNAAQDFHGRES